MIHIFNNLTTFSKKLFIIIMLTNVLTYIIMNVINEKITIFHAIKVIHCIFISFLIPMVLYNYILYPNKFTKVIEIFYYFERILILLVDANFYLKKSLFTY